MNPWLLIVVLHIELSENIGIVSILCRDKILIDIDKIFKASFTTTGTIGTAK